MVAPRKYPHELREWAQRMVAESMSEDPALTLNGAVNRIGRRVGVVPDTLRGWVKQAAIDAGQRPGVTTAEASRVKELEREVKELKRANEILLAALTHIDQLRYGEPGFRPLRMAVEASGSMSDMLPERAGPALRWRSDTPFAPYRHPHRHQLTLDFLAAEVGRELMTRALPSASEVRTTEGAWLNFRRRRTIQEPELRAFGLEVRFDDPVEGPLARGALSHFGLGLFRPIP